MGGFGGWWGGWWNPWWWGYGLNNPPEPQLEPGYWNIRGAIDKVLVAGAGGSERYFPARASLLPTASLPALPANLPAAAIPAPASPTAPASPAATPLALTPTAYAAAAAPTTPATPAATPAPDAFGRHWDKDRVLQELQYIDDALYRFWLKYGSLAAANWHGGRQEPSVAELPTMTSSGMGSVIRAVREVDLSLVARARGSSNPYEYAIRVPNDWDSEKVAAYILQLVTDASHESRWSQAFLQHLTKEAQARDGDHKPYEKWVKQTKIQVLRKAAADTEFYLKFIVGALPGGSGALVLTDLTNGDYKNAAWEVVFLVPWGRLAGKAIDSAGGLRIVAKNMDEVIVPLRSLEKLQSIGDNIADNKQLRQKLQELGESLKTGGKNGDEIVEALEKAGIGGIRDFTPGIAGLRDAVNFVEVRMQGLRYTCGLNVVYNALKEMGLSTAVKFRVDAALRSLIRVQEGLDAVQLRDFINNLADDHVFALTQHVVRETDLPEMLSKNSAVFAFVNGNHWVRVISQFEREGKMWVRVFDSGRGGSYDQLMTSFMTRARLSQPWVVIRKLK
jgi:hypothetical protein